MKPYFKDYRVADSIYIRYSHSNREYNKMTVEMIDEDYYKIEISGHTIENILLSHNLHNDKAIIYAGGEELNYVIKDLDIIIKKILTIYEENKRDEVSWLLKKVSHANDIINLIANCKNELTNKK